MGSRALWLHCIGGVLRLPVQLGFVLEDVQCTAVGEDYVAWQDTYRWMVLQCACALPDSCDSAPM